VLNNDTTVDSGALRALVEVVEADPRVGAVGSVIYDAGQPERVLTWGGGRLSLATGHTEDATGPSDRIDFLTGASLLLRAAALREVGTFDPSYFFTWEDVDLCVRLRERGWRLAVAEGSRVWHENGGTAPPLSPMRVREHVAGAVTFLRTHGRVPRLTSLPLLGHYALRALRRRDRGIWTAAWAGWRAAWKP
jgi:GT2 family glycosyltransferase